LEMELVVNHLRNRWSAMLGITGRLFPELVVDLIVICTFHQKGFSSYNSIGNKTLEKEC